MRSGAAAGTVGHFHEAALYASDGEFVEVIAPFVLDGCDAGEPVVVACNTESRQLLEREVGPDTFVFVPHDAQYSYPAATIVSYQRMLAVLVAGGAEQIRLVGEIPHPGTGRRWGPWARYESAINATLDMYPLWAICPYDLRITSPSVIADVIATHQHLATRTGHVANPGYIEPHTYLANAHHAEPLPASRVPGAELFDPTPRESRQAIAAILAASALSIAEQTDFELALSEIVTNAVLYGVPPVRVTGWATSEGGCVVEIVDHGPGPTDPFAGLWSVDVADRGGRGLWLAHQLCEVDLIRTPVDVTVRLSMDPRRAPR